MNLDRWKWVGGFAAGIVVGIIFFSAWTYADSLEDVERRVSALEAGRLAEEAELRVRERTAEPGRVVGPGAQLVADAQARLVANMGVARPVEAGRGCEVREEGRSGVSQGGRPGGSMSASKWLEAAGSGS